MKSHFFITLAVIIFGYIPSHAAPTPPVILTELGVKNLGLETVTVEEADFETTIFALGRTESIPENRAILSSRIEGRVAENQLKIGNFVEKDAALVLLESRQPGDPPPTIWLKAPAKGTIISINTSLGAPVEPTDRLAEIADLSTIYLIATVPQATAGKIKQGTEAKVRFPIRPEKEYTATLLKFAACPCPDPACALGQDTSTRSANQETADLNSAQVIFTIANPDNQLRPGMNAEVSIIMEKRAAVLSVPRDAIQGNAANRHVYIKHPVIPNAFDRVIVQTGLSNNGRVEIRDGLLPGDEVVTRGSYSLDFADSDGAPSLKEAMDQAHGHEHNEDGSEKSPDELAESAAEHGDHDHESHSISMREIFFMAATGILALLLVIVSSRHLQPENANSELS
jgi:multidrug efflux pump subunit AcrA (membrane-fusion protein)